MIVPPSDAAQRRTHADATVTRGLHHDGLTGHATTSAFVPVDLNYGSLSAAAGLSITAAVTAGGAVAHDCPSPSPLQADDPSSFVSATASATAAVFDTTSRLSVGLGTASPATESMTVTTDKPDYAPGDIATFVVAGVRSGSSVAFLNADLASDPGINGIADV